MAACRTRPREVPGDGGVPERDPAFARRDGGTGNKEHPCHAEQHQKEHREDEGAPLQWETEFDCIRKMREWILEIGLATEAEIQTLETNDRETVEGMRKAAWEAYLTPILQERDQVADMIDEIAKSSSHTPELINLKEQLAALSSPFRRDLHATAHSVLRILREEGTPSKQVLVKWKQVEDTASRSRYGSHLYTGRVFKVEEVKPIYTDKSPTLMGYEVINALRRDRLRRFGLPPPPRLRPRGDRSATIPA